MTDERFRIIAAAFRFFTAAKQNLAGFVWLTIWSLVPVAVFAVFIAVVLFPNFVPDAENQAETLGRGLMLFPIVFFGLIITFLMISTAWIRFLANGRNAPWIPLRLGADEGRVFVVAIVVSIVTMAAQMILMIAAMIPFFLLRLGSGPDELDVVWTAIFIVMIYVPNIAISLYLTVRLYPAFALTVIEKKIILFDAWRATKGDFWPALGAVILASFTSVLLYLAVLLLMTLPGGLWSLDGPVAQSTGPTDMVNLITTPIHIVLSGVFMLAMVWMMAIPVGPIAYIAKRNVAIKRGEGDP